MCSGLAENDEVVAVEDSIDVGQFIYCLSQILRVVFCCFRYIQEDQEIAEMMAVKGFNKDTSPTKVKNKKKKDKKKKNDSHAKFYTKS